MPMQKRGESWIFVFTLLSAAASLMSVAASEIFLPAACLLWIVLRPRRFELPAYAWPLAAFMLTTVLSFVMSPDHSVGRHQIGKFVLFPMGLLAANFVDDARRVRLVFRVLLVAAAAEASVALVQFVLKERRFLATQNLADDPMAAFRVKGFMSHWMTFSGGQLLVWCAVIPLIMWLGRRWIVPFSLVGIGIVFSYTRSAWLGAVSGMVTASLWIPKKQLVRILIPIVVAALLASPFIYHRLALSLAGNFAPDYGRGVALKVGIGMVRDHPLFGVGLERVPREFFGYYRGGNIDAIYAGHLQNDFTQIAAERGLICLAAFLWYLVSLYRSFWVFARRGSELLRLTAISALCTLTGFLVMGLFEFNFGDSEPLILFLFLTSIPFAVAAKELRK